MRRLGLEPDPNLYVGHLVQVLREARRVLADDGVLWLNLGDSYAGTGKSGGGVQGARWEDCGIDVEGPRGGKWMPPPAGLMRKNLIGIPWRAALALQADGWILRRDVIWAKGASFVDGWSGNPMPESVTDRPTAAHEFIFLLSKQERYFYDHEAVRERAEQTARGAAASFKRASSKRAQALPGQASSTHRNDREDVAYNQDKRNLRDVWGVCTQPFPGAHFAVFRPDFVRPMVLAGTSAAGHCPACGTRERAQTGSGGGNVLAVRRMGSDRFEPACRCDAEPVPDSVLDLFGGSGTTAQVALDLGRRAVLIEANPDYAAMQEERAAAGRLGIPCVTERPARAAATETPDQSGQPDLFALCD